MDKDVDLETDVQLALAKMRTRMSSERSQLANERTFLSWIRTGLAGVGGGVAIVRLLTFQSETHQFVAEIVGFILVIWGMAIFVLSFLDYQKSAERLDGGNRIVGSIWTVSILVLTLMVLSVLLLLIIFKGI